MHGVDWGRFPKPAYNVNFWEWVICWADWQLPDFRSSFGKLKKRLRSENCCLCGSLEVNEMLS